MNKDSYVIELDQITACCKILKNGKLLDDVTELDLHLHIGHPWHPKLMLRRLKMNNGETVVKDGFVEDYREFPFCTQHKEVKFP